MKIILLILIISSITFACSKEGRFHRKVSGTWEIENVDNGIIDSTGWVLNTDEINEINFFEKGMPCSNECFKRLNKLQM